MDRLEALPGCRVGSWRGLPMHVPDVTTPAGRAIVSTALTGTDRTIHEDLGRANGPIQVTGLLAGDDYVAQARAMMAACEARGPGTLVHPWLGDMLVVLVRPADLTFRSDQLRTAQIRFEFERWTGASIGGLGTLAAIASAVGGISGAVGALLSIGGGLVGGGLVATLTSGLATVRAALATASLGADLLSRIVGLTLAVPTELGARVFGLAVDGVASALGGVTIARAVALIEDAAGAAVWIDGLVGGLAAAGVPAPSPAIGVGPLGRASEADLDPLATVEALLTVARATASAAGAAEEGDGLVTTALAVAAIAAATEPLAAVGWESRQQAEAARARVTTTIDVVASGLTGASATAAVAATRRQTWTALAALRRAIHQDLDERIGRLPAVMTITPPTRVSAWLVAQYLFGDDPKAVLTGFEDIVRRNRLAHPSICDVASIEVLPQ